MGFYFGPEQARASTEDWSPTITAREYVSALSSSIEACSEDRAQACRRCQLGLRYLAAGLPGPAILVFSDLVQRHPGNEHPRRLLGIAHLSWGQLEPAVTHLEIALSLLRRKAGGTVGFGERLRLQCEAALLRMVLVRLHMRLGQVEAAQWLAKEAQEIL